MTRTWKLWDDVSLIIHEPPLTGDNLGLKTWASSYMLAKRIETIAAKHKLKEPELDSDPPLKVLELGSGTGLVGLAAAALWRCPVVLTDLPEIVPNLRRNAQLNRKVIHQRGGCVTVETLDWDQPPPASITRGSCQVSYKQCCISSTRHLGDKSLIGDTSSSLSLLILYIHQGMRQCLRQLLMNVFIRVLNLGS